VGGQGLLNALRGGFQRDFHFTFNKIQDS